MFEHEMHPIEHTTGCLMNTVQGGHHVGCNCWCHQMAVVPKSPAVENTLEAIGQEAFGRSRAEARKEAICIACGQPAGIFRDELSEREFAISGFCQKCQDNFFGEEVTA